MNSYFLDERSEASVPARSLGDLAGTVVSQTRDSAVPERGEVSNPDYVRPAEKGSDRLR